MLRAETDLLRNLAKGWTLEDKPELVCLIGVIVVVCFNQMVNTYENYTLSKRLHTESSKYQDTVHMGGLFKP